MAEHHHEAERYEVCRHCGERIEHYADRDDGRAPGWWHMESGRSECEATTATP